MEESFQLPNGHLLNLQPRRLRNGKRTRPSLEDIGGVRHQGQGLGAGEQREPRDSSELSGGASEATHRKAKPTKLPVLKAFADKGDNQSKEKSPKCGQKERGLNLRIQPKKSFGVLERGSPKTTDKEREQYWRRVRDKRNNESPKSRSKDKQKEYYHEAYRKIISLASSPRQEIAKHKLKHPGATQGFKVYKGGSKLEPDTKPPEVGGQSMLGKRPGNEQEFPNKGEKKWHLNRDQNTSLSSNGSRVQKSPGKTETTTGSSDNSYPSISPVSGPSTSMTEWEDRFVVNMPSAREPNPPTMDAQQIVEFQKSIERVHKEGGSMLDPETLPSPRTNSPDEQDARRVYHEKILGTFDGQDLRSNNSKGEDEGGLTGPGHPRYYCPDEIGKPRFSTIWEESSNGPKRTSPQANPDGSFLGCKEINGPDDINPDEILLFSTMEERPRIVDVSSPMPKKSRESNIAAIHQMVAALEEKTVVQEEWKPISQNLKHAQCSKLRTETMCREAKCAQSEPINQPNAQGKENNTRGKPTKCLEKHKRSFKEDDVFIITPTITRTMVTMADMSGHSHKHRSIQEPTSRSAGEIITDARTRSIHTKSQNASRSGLRRATQNSWERSNGPSLGPSIAAPMTNTPTVRHRAGPEVIIEKPRALRGYIRMPGMARSSTETLIDPFPNKLHQASVPNLTPRSGNATQEKNELDTPSTERSTPVKADSTCSASRREDRRRTISVAKIIEVAELDGLQVDDSREEISNTRTTALYPDFQDSEMRDDIKGIMNPETLNMIIDTLLLSAAHAQKLYRQISAIRRSKYALFKLLLNGVLRMLEHCLQVFRNLLAVFSIYTATGVWPRADEKDLARSLADFGRAMVYLVLLGFIMIIVGRAAGYVVLIGSWIVWFAKPFALVFGTVGRALLV